MAFCRRISVVRAARAHKISPTRAVELHQLVKSLSPKGICSRNLAECLMAQLTEEQLENRIVVGLINEQFENLIHRRYQKIASYFGVSEATVMSARAQIAQLDPAGAQNQRRQCGLCLSGCNP